MGSDILMYCLHAAQCITSGCSVLHALAFGALSQRIVFALSEHDDFGV